MSLGRTMSVAETRVRPRYCSSKGNLMVRNTRLQVVAVLAIGLLGGYLAASGRIQLPPRAQAEPAAQQATSVRLPPCCEGTGRGQLLATADAPVAAMAPQTG